MPLPQRLTRREVAEHTADMRKSILELLKDDVYADEEGYAIYQWSDGEFVRIDRCLNGFVAMIKRLDPTLPTTAMEFVSMELSGRRGITQRDIEAVIRELNIHCERFLRTPRDVLADVARTEQIVIEMESLGIKEAA